jgi:hypothetical protein
MRCEVFRQALRCCCWLGCCCCMLAGEVCAQCLSGGGPGVVSTELLARVKLALLMLAGLLLQHAGE